jgi:REP element-mobilizing transposase RayT
MPCYLFTCHAFGSWMPDRGRGYVERNKGILPPAPDRAEQYRRNTRQHPVTFDRKIQRLLIEETRYAADRQQLRLHALALDPTHAHILVSWHDSRRVKQVRSNLKSSLTRRLNHELGKRDWFVANASRKRIRDRKHFNYLVNTYLPNHRGLFWSEVSAGE